MKKYTEKEIVKLLVEFGEHCVEQATGKKIQAIGELHKWWTERESKASRKEFTVKLKSVDPLGDIVDIETLTMFIIDDPNSMVKSRLIIDIGDYGYRINNNGHIIDTVTPGDTLLLPSKDEISAASSNKEEYHLGMMQKSYGKKVPVKFAAMCCGNSFDEGAKWMAKRINELNDGVQK